MRVSLSLCHILLPFFCVCVCVCLCWTVWLLEYIFCNYFVVLLSLLCFRTLKKNVNDCFVCVMEMCQWLIDSFLMKHFFFLVIAEASRSNSSASSPLPPQLQTIQPALAKLTEVIIHHFHSYIIH